MFLTKYHEKDQVFEISTKCDLNVNSFLHFHCNRWFKPLFLERNENRIEFLTASQNFMHVFIAKSDHTDINNTAMYFLL